MFSSFPFFRYGHQTADIKPFPKLTSARLFSQEPRKKLSLRRHKASLKIFEDKACKVPIKSSFFVAFIALVKTLFISTSSLSHGDKPDRFSLLAGRRYGRAEFQKRGLGKRGHETWAKLAQKFPSVSVFCSIIMTKDTMRKGSTIVPTPRSETARLTSRVFKVGVNDESFVKA